MPRYVQLLLGKFNAKVWMPLGLLLAIGIGIGYNRAETTHETGNPHADYETSGIAPTRQAGVLSQVGRNDLEIVGLRGTLSNLQTELDYLKNKKDPVVPTNPCTEKMRRELQQMQAQLLASTQARTVATAPPPPPEPKSRARRVTPLSPPSDDDSKTSKRRLSILTPSAASQGAGQAEAGRSERVPYLPAQSVAEGRTIDGYTALAVEGAFPLTIELTSPFSLADGSEFPVGNCRLGALGDAEELTARSRLSLTQITCVVSGQVIEAPIEGYVTAKDNINGLIAEVFWHEREVLAAFGKGAVPAVLVSLFEETRRVVDVSSVFGVVTSTGATVAQKTAERMVDIYLDKAEKLSSPVIWVPDNLKLNIYITKGASLQGLDTGRMATRSFHEGFSK